MKRFADRLREARVAAGLTQEQLGFAVGVTKSSVSAWENDREFPGFKVLPLLKEALGCSLDELIAGGSGKSAARAAVHDELIARDVDERALLVRFRALGAQRRKAILELVRPSKGSA